VQPAKEEARPSPSNKSAATANRQPAFSIPQAPQQAENKTAKATDGIARTSSRAIGNPALADDRSRVALQPTTTQGSPFSDDRGPQAPVTPVIKTANGTAANSSARESNGAANLPTVQTLQPKPEAAKPEVSFPRAAAPAMEIYRGYTIEAATSYTKDLAEQFAAAYRKQGYDAAVENYRDERTGTNKFRVLIGAFATRPAAEQKAAQIAGILMKDYRVVGLK
jgi:hypothetical protein